MAMLVFSFRIRHYTIKMNESSMENFNDFDPIRTRYNSVQFGRGYHCNKNELVN